MNSSAKTTIVVLLLLVIVLLAYSMRRAPIPGSPTEIVPASFFEPIKQLPEALFKAAPSYFGGSGSGGGSYTNGHQVWSGTATAQPADPLTADPMEKLLQVVLGLEAAAKDAFGLVDINCSSFGRDEFEGPRIQWDITQAGPSSRSTGHETFRANHRFVLVSLHYVANDNPAAYFYWTLFVDRKTISITLHQQYFATSPVYIVPGVTPDLGHRLSISATSSP